ncbi:MAG: calcium-binding protein, partial [Cyanothece sp. SIO1E1]|nr:calcium-binding protein [Cyanothece sp. SIO1E1]
DDSVLGGDGNDTLSGGTGNDTLLGGGGADTLLVDAGDDFLDGGFFIDTIDASATTAGVTILLGGIDGTILGATGAEIGTDTLAPTFENAIGGAGNDSILGNAALIGNVLEGLGGNDTLDGSAGADTVDGGADDDSVVGGLGDDSVLGGDGNDTLAGGAGNDTLLGGAGADVLMVDAGDDFLDGGDFIDTIDASATTAGVTILIGGADGTILAATGTEIGTDTLAPRFENVIGGAGNDSILGNAAPIGNVLEGLGGEDTLDGSTGADTVDGGTGNDSVVGGSGDDSVLGGEGNDTLAGGAGNDTLLGGAGADTLVVDAGDDFLDGGDFIDTIDASATTAGVTILIGGADGTVLAATGTEIGTDTLAPRFENVIGGAGDDSILGNAAPIGNTLEGLGGEDTLDGSTGADTVDGGADDDTVAGGLGDDLILGGDGDDIVRGDLNTSDSQGDIDGGNDTLFGGAGNDSLGAKSGDDELFGGIGDDLLFGDDGDDILRGGVGNDTLIGDDFSGGEGSDTFVFAAGEGTDTIEDFEVGIDFIGLADGLTFGALTFAGDSILLGSETLAILEGIDTTTLTEASFSVI